MPLVITLNRDDLFRHIQLSCDLPMLTEKIASHKLILKTASELGVKPTAEELQLAADHFRQVNQLHHVNQTCDWLQTHHLSLDDFEELIQINLISEKLAKHLFGDQVESYFYQHQLNYAGAAIYEVIVQDSDWAIELFYALQEGEITFHEVTQQHVQAVELRRTGGFRGIMNRTQLKPEISAAVFAASPPQLLKPIATSKGTHLIFVEEIIQPQLDDLLYAQILGDLFSRWLKQKVEQIEILMDF